MGIAYNKAIIRKGGDRVRVRIQKLYRDGRTIFQMVFRLVRWDPQTLLLFEFLYRLLALTILVPFVKWCCMGDRAKWGAGSESVQSVIHSAKTLVYFAFSCIGTYHGLL